MAAVLSQMLTTTRPNNFLRILHLLTLFYEMHASHEKRCHGYLIVHLIIFAYALARFGPSQLEKVKTVYQNLDFPTGRFDPVMRPSFFISRRNWRL